MKINPQRLSKIIMNREVKSSQDFMLKLYNQMTPDQRTEIREMFKRNARLLDSKKAK